MQTLTSATHARHLPRRTSPQSHNRNTIPKLNSYDNRNNRNKFSYKQPLCSYGHVTMPSYETPPSPPLRPPYQPAPRSWQRPHYPTPPIPDRNKCPKLHSYSNRNKKCHQRPVTPSPGPVLVAGNPTHNLPVGTKCPKLDSYSNRNKKRVPPATSFPAPPAAFTPTNAYQKRGDR